MIEQGMWNIKNIAESSDLCGSKLDEWTSELGELDGIQPEKLIADYLKNWLLNYQVILRYFATLRKNPASRNLIGYWL